jgi:hypothetical protein
MLNLLAKVALQVAGSVIKQVASGIAKAHDGCSNVQEKCEEREKRRKEKKARKRAERKALGDDDENEGE